jgi:hypothetical protein
MTAVPRILRVGEEPPPLDAGTVKTGTLKRAKGKRSSAGRFHSLNAFVDVALRDLTRAELAVWLILWRDTKPDGLARTSQGDMARRAGCDARTVRRALAKLQSSGLVRVVSAGGLPRRLTVYRVDAPDG